VAVKPPLHVLAPPGRQERCHLHGINAGTSPRHPTSGANDD